MQTETFEWPVDYVDPYQEMLADFVSDIEAKVRNGESTLEAALSEAAESEFARTYGLSEGFIAGHVSPDKLEFGSALGPRM